MGERLQIKSDRCLTVATSSVAFSLDEYGEATTLFIDDRIVPIETHAGLPRSTVLRVVAEFARVPAPLRALLTRLRFYAAASDRDAEWGRIYGLPVAAGMGAVASGRVNVYPRGLASLDAEDGDAFARGMMHELGHVWSLRAWVEDESAQAAWREAIARDEGTPSAYARRSYAHSGLPYEDAAEATALYFLVRGTAVEATHRAQLAARFTLLDERFFPSAGELAAM